MRRTTRDGFVVDGVTVLEAAPQHVRLEVDGVATSYRVSQTRGQKSPGGGLPPREVWVDGPVRSACLREVPRFTDPADQVASGSLLAPMPGTVVKVMAEPGGAVAAGDVLAVVEGRLPVGAWRVRGSRAAAGPAGSARRCGPTPATGPPCC